jgi:uncharacterized membrane protein
VISTGIAVLIWIFVLMMCVFSLAFVAVALFFCKNFRDFFKGFKGFRGRL